MPDEPREVIGYRLVLTIAGPGFSEISEIEDEDRLELMPTFADINGVTYERYGDENDYVEWRFDYIIARSVQPIFAEPERAVITSVDELDAQVRADDSIPRPGGEA